jgi:HEPN domain-containing protein
MIEDFASAASRHLHAATQLMAGQVADDSAYLAGYVAECGIKAVILKAGIRFKRDVHELSSPQLLLAADLCFAARRFPLDLDPDLAEIQTTWTTDLRYVRTGAIAQQQAEEMLERAQAVFARTIGKMVLDGFLDEIPE